MPADAHHYTCPWCGQKADDVRQTSCRACGSPLDVRAAVTRSGWTEMPPINDMAKLQFGQSFCQIEGSYVPVADFKLAMGDGVYFGHHELLWKDPQVKLSRMRLAQGWRRLLAGMPLVMLRADGPGRIAFSKDKPGETVALPLAGGQAVDVSEHAFMVATGAVAYECVASNIWFDVREDKSYKRHYPMGMYLDRFTAGAAPGLLLLHGGGNVFTRQLEPYQTILVKPTALLFKDPSVKMQMYIEHPGGAWQQARTKNWSQRSLWLRLHGPGRVAIQSHYHRWEDPPEPVQKMPAGAKVVDW